MPITLAQAVRQLEKERYELAVWKELVSVLRKCVDDEVSNATSAIATDDYGNVPQPVIEVVIKHVYKHKIEPLTENIASLESLSVEETNDKEDKKIPRAKTEQPNKKGIRTINRGIRNKDKKSN